VASRSGRVITAALGAALCLWVWALAGVLFAIRWTSIERPALVQPRPFPRGEMRVGVDASYPPFAVATADDLWGLDIDLARALGDHFQTPVRFVNLGFDGLYDALLTEQVDVLISALIVNPAQMDHVAYTRSYFDAGLVLVAPAESDIDSMTDLPGRTLALELGSEAQGEANRWLRRVLPFTIHAYETPAAALDAVRLGHSSAALADQISARLYMREQPDWRIHQSSVTSTLFAIAVRADQPRLAAALNRALDQLEADGTLGAIIDRYL
jgi:ABC-type amino acid transport substrate-binding protein